MKITFAIPGFRVDSKSTEGQAVRRVISLCARRVGSVSYIPGAVVFTIDGAFTPRSSKKQNAAALETLLAALCALNRIWLRFHPGAFPLLAHSSVYYARTDIWDTIPALLRRGFGDCKSLSACEVAEFRQEGTWCRPVFRFQGNAQSTMFHILIMLEDGSWKDPSAERGMNSYQEMPGISGAAAYSY